MKSKFLLFLVLAAFSFSLSAQPLNWKEDSPAEWVPIVMKPDFVKFSEGNKSIKITFTETGTPYFVSDEFNVTASAAYNFSIDILDNDPGAELNLRVRFLDATGAGTNQTSSSYTVDDADFKTYTFTGTAPANAVKAYVIVRLYDVTTAWTGSGTFNLDKASFTQGGDNLLLNPGFELWNAPVIPEKSTIIDWWEDSPTNFVPMTIVPELTKVSHGFVSAKITFTETGTPYFVSDTIEVAASAAYNFSIDVLDNDPGAEVNLRVRFIDATGAGTNVTATAYSADNENFQTYSLSGTTPANAVKAYVILRIYDVSAAWTGSGTFFIDNASFTLGSGKGNLLPNWSFEEWQAPTNLPEILNYSFQGLTPAVTGTIDKTAHTVSLAVPFATNLTALVGTFELTEGATAKVGEVDQVSGTTANDFTNPVTYKLTAGNGTTNQDWVVTVAKNPASTAKSITSFVLEALNPDVFGAIDEAQATILLAVPTGTSVTALVPSIAVSPFATVSPATGVAQNFTNPVTYTVTAQDGSTKAYVVTVEQTSETILFQEYFESVPRLIPASFKLIDNDDYTPNAGDTRWADSAWVVTTSSRPEFAGNHMAVALSYYSNMPADGRTDDWMILPSVTIGANTTLSWKAMSLTSSGNYPDSYRVIIAPSSTVLEPNVAYFEENGLILLTINNESWSAAVGNPGQGIASRSISLKDHTFAGQPVWIAFVLITGNGGGSYLAVDEIKLIEGASTGINTPNELKLDVNVYPNPTNGLFNIALYSDKNATAQIEVLDLVGRKVFNTNVEVGLGENIIGLNASNFDKGLYLVRTKMNGKVNVTKIMIN
jgi:hypothetical protein